MNIAIILAGGNGSRMKVGSEPKQYMMIQKKPIISYCLETFEAHKQIDGIIIVAEEEWHDFMNEWLHKDHITKFCGYAVPGRTRQHSIYNGLKAAKGITPESDGIVIIHDAARPMVSEKIISDCIEGATKKDGAMPVISVKDTIYTSHNGKIIEGLLNRDELFAGQAPESFRLDKYLAIHDTMSDDDLGNIRGSSEIAYRAGMEIVLIEGSEDNFKITTKVDYDKFKKIMEQ